MSSLWNLEDRKFSAARNFKVLAASFHWNSKHLATHRSPNKKKVCRRDWSDLRKKLFSRKLLLSFSPFACFYFWHPIVSKISSWLSSLDRTFFDSSFSTIDRRLTLHLLLVSLILQMFSFFDITYHRNQNIA